MILIENIYSLFGSDKPINRQTLKKRYRQYSKILHPDVINNSADKLIFTPLYQKLSQSYNLLLDKEFKQAYDRILVKQIDNIEVLNFSDNKIIDFIDCDFTSESDKLILAQLELKNCFKLDKYKVFVFYFLKISPDLSLKLIQSIAQNGKNTFFDFYFDFGYEILLQHESYFEKFISILNSLKMNDTQKEILDTCNNYLDNAKKKRINKNTLLNNNSKLLYLIEIKHLEKVTKANN